MIGIIKYMKTFFIALISTLAPLLVLDAVWLSTTLKGFYSPKLAHLTAQSPSYTPAIIFYIVYAIGLTILVILPAIQGNFSLTKIFCYGALMGLMAYAAYDLTNQSTLKDWPVVVTIVDMAWGTFLSGVVSVISVYIVGMF